MNVLDVLRGLLRRWYIVVPGAIVAIVAAVGMWAVTPSEYERSASQLLLPGAGVLPDGVTNQYLYLGGLAPVADVLTRAVGSGELVESYRAEGIETVITRDAAATGPVILLTVTARSASSAEEAIDALLKETATTLDQLQADQKVAEVDRVTVSTIAVDTKGTVSNRSRLLMAGVVGFGLLLASIVLASVMDGLSTRRRRVAAADQRPQPEMPEPELELDDLDGYEAVRAEQLPERTPPGPDHSS
ncbi:hypothetical protein L2X99_10310 [Microbacterium sp. KUDC0406]|uniref:hypothetical protein n=1 Tax=Microbacterium sp. KUDC0406 TaxID=2909588 RepID=UPI001F30AA7E|nr:hypothetical protein [Microbacterium sp. KUDC0406]UJP08881.1 hypothetical protein L2X99_10310 [Microbacterium sp. KUDC0406]